MYEYPNNHSYNTTGVPSNTASNNNKTTTKPTTTMSPPPITILQIEVNAISYLNGVYSPSKTKWLGVTTRRERKGKGWWGGPEKLTWFRQFPLEVVELLQSERMRPGGGRSIK